MSVNIFKVYDMYKDIAPYSIIGDTKWWRLSPRLVAQLIKERFSPWYTGKLTKREQKKLSKSSDNCEKNQKNICKYKCEKNFISYDCQFKENGRCSNYFKIDLIE